MSIAPFKPRIELRENGWLITAPRDTRQQIWEILNAVSDDCYFEKKGTTPTQITLEQSPGYTSRLTLLFAAAATYIAASPLDLELLLALNIESQLKQLKAQVQIPAVKDDLTTGEIEPVMRVLLTGFARKQLKSIRNLEIENIFNIDSGGIHNHWLGGLQGYKRLLYTDPSRVLISKEELAANKIACEQALQILEDQFNKAQELNLTITRLKRQTLSLVNAFNEASEYSDVNLITISSLYRETAKELEETRKTLLSIIKGFDMAPAMEANLTLGKLTPPAPPEPNRK